MKTINVAEATGPALDWLVAKCEEVELNHIERSKAGGVWLWLDMDEDDRYVLYTPSTDWAQGGPLIERMLREGLRLTGYKSRPTDPTSCQAQIGDIVTGGPTPLIAAMRCYLASKLGPTAEVPEELCAPK